MEIQETRINGVFLIKNDVYYDNRGKFMEIFNEKSFIEYFPCTRFVQDNLSYSKNKHTLRGLHYQIAPFNQKKLVQVIKGSIMDVVVDIRKGSPTFGEYISIELSEDNNIQLFIPGEIAHGFCTLVSDTFVHYKVDRHYSPKHEGGIIWSDPTLDIKWPTYNPILSDKDKCLQKFTDIWPQ